MKVIAKVIAKVTGHRTVMYAGKDETLSLIDVYIPTIIYQPDTREFILGETQRIIGCYPIGTTLEIESIFYAAGEHLHGNILDHDCYIHNVKIID